jgi:hypothetical protein
MAELASVPEPSTVMSEPSVDGQLRARLPQAQAENILASLAGRSGSSVAPVHNGHLSPRPAGARPGREPTAPADHRASGHEPGPAPVGARPRSPDAALKFKPLGPLGAVAPARGAHASAAAAGERENRDDGGAGNGDRRAGHHAGPPRPTDPYNNDILPAKPRSRLRFRLR